MPLAMLLTSPLILARPAGTDLAGRVQDLIQTTDPILILVGLSGLMVLITLALFGYRFALLGVLMAAASFTGIMWTSVNLSAGILRWIVLALLAFNILRLRTNPGMPVILYLLYIGMGVLLIPLSEELLWSVQIGGLFVLSGISAVVLADSVQTKADLQKMLNIYLGTAACWLALALFALPGLLSSRGGRFSGVMNETTHFVLAGGMLLPIVVWGAFTAKKKRWKAVLVAMTVLVLVVLFLSGQRTGTFAGILGSLPVIASRGRKAVFILAGAAILLLVSAALLSVINPAQLDFVVRRFSSASTTGRTEIWRTWFEAGMESPIVGSGFGGDRAFQLRIRHPAHNVYLAVWCSTGIPGLFLFVGSLVSGLWISWRVYRQSSDPEIRSVAIMLFGLIITQVSAGFFETISSPSTFATLVRLMTLALIGRIGAIPVAASSAMARYFWSPRTGQWYMYVPGISLVPSERRR